ncbi:hypothetical protein ACLOJK_004817 [Asimina triloba]
MDVKREVVLSEVELEVRVRVVVPSLLSWNRYQLGLVEAGIEVGFEWGRVVCWFMEVELELVGVEVRLVLGWVGEVELVEVEVPGE